MGNAVGAGLSAWNDGTVSGMWIVKDFGGWSPSSPPSISCSGGGGSGAAATAYVVPASETNDPEIAGMLYTITQTAAGSSYTSAPACTFSSGSGTATIGTSIDQPIFDLGNGQGSPPDWPMGQCGTHPTTCWSGIEITGSYVIFSGINVQNLRMQANTGSGLNDEHTTMVGMLGNHDTVANMFVHGLFTDCYFSGSCSTAQDEQFDAIGDQNLFDEVANSVVENGDSAFVGNSTQQSNGICAAGWMCSSTSFGIATATQGAEGPVSVHGNIVYGDGWQLRMVGWDASGSLPFLSYNNSFWLTTYEINTSSHINARYMQLGDTSGDTASLVSWNNLVHNQVGGTSSQIQCPPGSSFTYYNEVTWAIGTGTPPYGLDMADVSGTGGCTLTLYNDTVYDNNGVTCVTSQSGSNTTNVVMQNLHCISGSTAPNPFWTTATGSVYKDYAGSSTQANVQAASTVQSTTTASGQGYAASNAFSPTSANNGTVNFASGGGTANLTILCTGNLTALCADINGVARPSSGGWQSGAYEFQSGSSNLNGGIQGTIVLSGKFLKQ